MHGLDGSAGDRIDLHAKHVLAVPDLPSVALATLELDHVQLVGLEALDDLGRDRGTIDVRSTKLGAVVGIRVSDGKDLVEDQVAVAVVLTMIDLDHVALGYLDLSSAVFDDRVHGVLLLAESVGSDGESGRVPGSGLQLKSVWSCQGVTTGGFHGKGLPEAVKASSHSW